METQSNISHQKQEIWNLIQDSRYHIVDIYDVEKVRKSISKTDSKLYKCITNNPLGCLGQDFIKLVNMYVFDKDGSQYSKIKEIWRINTGLDRYINASVEEKAEILKYIDFKSTSIQHCDANCDDQNNDKAERSIVGQQVYQSNLYDPLLPKLYDPLLRFLKIGEYSRDVRFEALDQKFIKLIYLSQDQELINWFKKHLPIPPLHIFDVENQPDSLVQIENKKQTSLKKFFISK
ncbi:MAG: hypothetical protein H0T62_14045 [Parachlamydiaceae bacterium]|nr:hypothetical protein [Parachlamydiaceae bacterium]